MAVRFVVDDDGGVADGRRPLDVAGKIAASQEKRVCRWWTPTRGGVDGYGRPLCAGAQ